jgi:hypothetical protein
MAERAAPGLLRRPLLAAAVPALAALAGCGPAGAPGGGPDPGAAFALSRAELPAGNEDGCDCVTRRMCPVLEQVPGGSELRNVSCRWIEPGIRARCRYETRFTADLPPYDGNGAAGEPGPWQQQELVARLLPQGRWCAESADR